MANNDFKPFATGSGANVVDQPSYLALQALATGFQSGIAQSAQINKVLRQVSTVSAMIGQFVADRSGQPANDDGNIPVLEANFITAIQQITRVKALAPVNFYVNASSGNDSNNGASPSTAFKTIAAAVNLAYFAYDYNGFTPTINVANGTYAVNAFAAVFTGNPIGAPGINLVGNPGSPSNVVLNVTFTGGVGVGVLAQSGSIVNVSGFSVNVSGTGPTSNCFAVSGGAVLTVNNCIVGNAGSAQFGATNYGVLNVGSGITCGGTAAYGFNAGLGEVSMVAASVTFSPGATYTSAGAIASMLGAVFALSASFSGSFTGTRYISQYNSIINTGGGGANFFPGTVAGSTNNGGIYV